MEIERKYGEMTFLFKNKKVYPLWQVRDILQVSKPTLNEWRRLGRIKMFLWNGTNRLYVTEKDLRYAIRNSIQTRGGKAKWVGN